MANRAKGEGAITVDGKTYTLAFDVNAMCEVEFILDKPTDLILKSLIVSPPLHVVRALLWGGLLRHHAGIDLKQTGEIIESMGGAGPALESIGQALIAAFPDAPEGADEGPPPKGAAAGIGRRSSSRGAASGKTRNPSGA